MQTFFAAAPSDLDKLGPSESVDLLRDLLHMEASASGIPISAVDVPYAARGDGGIDGQVRGAAKEGVHGIIKKGTTCYRIKPGRSAPRAPEILSDGPGLKDGIRDCFEGGCTLVVAFTGWDGPENVEQELAEHGAGAGYPDARIEVWRQGRILGLLEGFPALELSVKGLNGAPSRTHGEWRRLADMSKQIHLGERQREFVGSLRARLRGRAQDTRVTGAPGMGKTRLVLEATDADDLRRAVVYFDGPSDVDRSFTRRLCGMGAEADAILVVDDCDPASQARIRGQLRGVPNARLVAVFAERGAAGSMPVPPLQDAEIGEILRGYVGDDPDVSCWIPWCSSSPRAAHVLGENLARNPENLLRPPDEVDVWGRYAGGGAPAKADRRLAVLRWLSLFEKFGFGGPRGGQAGRIARIVEREEGIPRGEFMTTIADLRKRGILRGGGTLHIEPKLLHLYLWRRWWRVYGADMFPKMRDLASEGEKGLREGLLGRCLGMFAHGRPVPKAAAFAADFLAPGGGMESGLDLETPLGARAFLALSKASPASALDYLGRTVCKMSAGDLLKLTTGRREVVAALERMALRGHLDGAAPVLLRLAEAEDGTSARSATRVFQRMFRPGLMPAGPGRMVRLLKHVMDSGSPAARRVGIGACDSALEGGQADFEADADGLEAPPRHRMLAPGEAGRYRLQLGTLRDRGARAGGRGPEGS